MSTQQTEKELNFAKFTASTELQQVSPMLFLDSQNPYGIERELSVTDLDVTERDNWPAILVQVDGLVIYGHRRASAVKQAILDGRLPEDATVTAKVVEVMNEADGIIAAIAENEKRSTPTLYQTIKAYNALTAAGVKPKDACLHFRKRDGSPQDRAFGSNVKMISDAMEKCDAFEKAVQSMTEIGHRTIYNVVNWAKGKGDGKLLTTHLEEAAQMLIDGSYTKIRDHVETANLPTNNEGNEGERGDEGEGESTPHGRVNNITGKKLISSNAGFRVIAKAAETIKGDADKYDVESFKGFLKLTAAIFNGCDEGKILKAFKKDTAATTKKQPKG